MRPAEEEASVAVAVAEVEPVLPRLPLQLRRHLLPRRRRMGRRPSSAQACGRPPRRRRPRRRLFNRRLALRQEHAV